MLASMRCPTVEGGGGGLGGAVHERVHAPCGPPVDSKDRLLGHAAGPEVLEAEPLLPQLLDRVRAPEVTDEIAVLSQLGHLVPVRLKLRRRAPIPCPQRPLSEARLEQLFDGEAEVLLELFERLWWSRGSRWRVSGQRLPVPSHIPPREAHANTHGGAAGCSAGDGHHPAWLEAERE